MASDGKGSSEMFTCGICTEPYDDKQHKAKFLTCFHTFCADCLSQWYKGQGGANTSHIQCPNCNQLTIVSGSGIAGLQTNFYIESMNELSNVAEESKSDKTEKGCQKHGNQQNFFCETCSVGICGDCVVLDHKETAGHVITGIQEATHAHRHTLEDQLLKSHSARAEIQNTIQKLESEILTTQDDKYFATENLIVFIQFAQRQLEQCRQEATDAISQHHATKQSKLMGKRRQLQQAEELLEKHISKSEETAQSDDISDIISSKGTLEMVTQITTTGQKGNCIKSDFISNPNILNERLRTIGQTYLTSILPIRVAFRYDEITAGLESVFTVELSTNAVDKFLFASCFFTVKMTDPQQAELPVTLNTSPPGCTVTFTPQVSGKHEISIMCLGQKLKSEQTHIVVKSNNPVLKFGKKGDGNGTFKYPWGIAMDNSGILYVDDCNNKLIQKFSDNGEFISQFFVNNHDNKCSILGMALDQNNGLIYCTEVEVKDGKCSARNKLLVFDSEGGVQHSHNLNNVTYPVYIAINRQHEIIMSDTHRGCLCKFDKHGKYLSCIDNLKFPTFITVGDDDSIIVSDRDNNCVVIFNSDGSVRDKFGSTGTGKGQLKRPYGVATDGEYILVANNENNRIQIFKYNGQFVSMIESKDDPLKGPRGLLVTQDGYVYVVDSGNSCVKKYKYRHVP